MLDRLRLLPTVILCASLLLVLKIADIATGGESGTSLAAISVAEASSPAPEAEAGEAEAAGAEDAGEQASGENQGEAAEGEQAAQTAPGEEAAAPLSKSEISVLESLSARREELKKRSDALDTREQLLAAAEKRVEDRIAELKAIEARISKQIGAQDAESEQRMAGLVSMYETMKPKDAARIFERLDMGVLIDVVKRMQPRKMSAVLAAMDPVVAQDLTVELALGDRMTEDAAEKPAASPPEQGAQAAPETVPAAAPGPAQKAS
ncbi:MAG: hypothetical protein RLO15_07905 [Parvibaculum sp.]